MDRSFRRIGVALGLAAATGLLAPEGRAQNRRVEIELRPSQPSRQASH